MSYLLDTCVVSELVAKRPNPHVLAWIDGIEEIRLYLSVITIGEIRKGIEKLANDQRRQAIEEWLKDELLVRFAGRILVVDTQVMLKWGELTGSLEKTGRTMPAIDSLIAAIALNSELSLVTRNEDDFKWANVPIVNPWEKNE